MPVTLFDRVPLPNLRNYTAFSVLLLSASLYHAFNVTSDPNWKSKNATISAGEEKVEFQRDLPNILFGNATKTSGNPLTDIVSYMLQEPICIWTLINMTYCVLLLLGRIIQHLVFGELRVSERQQVKDKFWNFVFYKFIFVFGVINVQYMDEVVLWVAWFTALGFLNLLTQLCKDRFEYLSFSATSGGWAGARLAVLLGAILTLDGLLMILCVAIGYFGGGLNTFAFMCAECVLLSIRATHVLFRYTMHVMEATGAIPEDENFLPLVNNARESVNHEEDEEDSNEDNQQNTRRSMGTSGPTCDKRAPFAHYTELCFDLVALIVDLAHHVHMLLWSNIFLSMASLVICMQLRYLFHEIQRKIKKHRNYVWVLNHMEKNYPMATPEELRENSDNCAICWEKMETARKLPCNHLFHNSCLSSWLQQDTSCPTCRMGLSLWPTRSTSADLSTQLRQPDHFFHFDGSRYVSWLPSFSVEVSHRVMEETQVTNSQIDAMARQVQQLFPHFPLSYLGRDLMVTHSVEMTVDNILDGRLVLPQRLVTVDDDHEMSPLSGVHPGTLQSPSISSTTAAPSQVLLHHSFSMLASQLANRQNTEPSTSTESEPNSSFGSAFSKYPQEREKLLQAKKEQLLKIAKKKYLEKLSSSKNQDVIPGTDLCSSENKNEDSHTSSNEPRPSTSRQTNDYGSSAGTSIEKSIT